MVPRWAFKGEAMFWFTDRHGERQQSGWPSKYDVYASFLTQDAWDRFHLSEAEYELLKEKEEDDKKDEDEKKDARRRGRKGQEGEKDDEEAEEEEKKDEIKLPDRSTSRSKASRTAPCA